MYDLCVGDPISRDLEPSRGPSFPSLITDHRTDLYPAEAGCEGVGDEGLHAAKLAPLIRSADLAGVRITRLLPDEEFLQINIFNMSMDVEFV